MRWTLLVGIIGITSGCCCTNTALVEYKQVSVVPVRKMVSSPCCTAVRPVVARVITPVVEPVMIDYVQPIDVTTTTIDFY